MTHRQKILRAVYPLWMWYAKTMGRHTTSVSKKNIIPPVSFYSLQGILNNGSVFDCSVLKGKKALLINTASDCGYTNQYAYLEKLYKQNKDKLTVIGFPSNDFKEQEKKNDAAIEKFCTINFGVTFPLMKKSSVIKGPQQNEIFQWLTDTSKNGWNNQQPEWNFCKYIVDEEGRLTNYFGSSIKPGYQMMDT